MPSVRVRFAPSPTGPLHIGGLRTALYNYLFAKANEGTFILRVEDTDQKRFVAGAEAYIIEALNWVGLQVDEGPVAGGDFGPYRQSERSALYAQYVQQLVDAGKAYYAFDTPEALDQHRTAAESNGTVFKYDANTRGQLDNSLGLSTEDLAERLASSEPRVVRLLVEPERKMTFKDAIRGEVTINTSELDDKVLLKADGLPTYHLANVVDDHEMRISHVIRGEEWLPSTAHHVLLYEAFGLLESMPVFAHLPLILKPVGKGKLSKRDGAKFGIPVFPLQWDDPQSGETYIGFRESGFLPGAAINFLAFLGWNPGTEEELFNLQELVDAFTLDKIGKSGARFDFDKAKWYNQQYIAALSDKEFAAQTAPGVTAAGINATPEALERIAPMMKARLSAIDALAAEAPYFFNAPRTFDDNQALKRLKKIEIEALEGAAEALLQVASWQADQIGQGLKGWANAEEVKLGILLPLYRIALTGAMSGPDVFELSAYLGREATLERWKFALAHFATLK